MNRADRPTLRCAIYTRVSTDHGLDQEFNSLDNQRESAEAYVKSQAHEGWRCLRDRYDDGGFSGGSMERPALQRLLDEIRARRVDVVVVYKVDRLTRSLADFAKLVELFDQQAVSFVSVTQAFNTTSSMGRLTLNVLLSFAQFEREVTGERIRDKIAASKQKGIWMGGVVPLGYRVEARALHVVEEHADVVRSIYRGYLELGSATLLRQALDQDGIVVPERTDGAGKRSGGKAFSRGHLYQILANPIYAGQIAHKGRAHPGQHAAIVEPSLWDAVQLKLASHTHARRRQMAATEHLLTGRIQDDRGNGMRPTHAKKGSRRYRYYVSAALQQGRRKDAGSVARVAAAEIEQSVCAELRQAIGASDQDDASLVRDHLQRVIIRSDVLELELTSAEVIRLPWARVSGQRRREIIVPDASGRDQSRPARSEDRARILSAMALARRWQEELLTGGITGAAAIAERETITERAVRTTLMLAYLSPRIVEAVIEGRLPRGIGIARLAELSPSWAEQHRSLGL